MNIGGEDDFDAYLNEISGEDVTSGSSDSFTTNYTGAASGDPSNPTNAGTPAVKTSGDPPVGFDGKPQAKAPPTQQQTPTAKGGQQPTQQQQPRIRPHALGGFVNDEGDIVDQGGKVIAQKGTVRRVYEENGRLRQRIQEQDQEVTRIRNQAQELGVLARVPQQYGLDNDDLARALDMAGRVKRGNVVEVAKELVALAAAQGHNVSEIIGEGVNDAVDMRAIKAMLEQHLGPLGQVRQGAEQDNRAMQAAKQMYNKFIDDNPHADIHESAIAAIAKTSKITPQKAYNSLLDFCRRHNYDFSQPLDEQVRARQAQQGAQPTGQQPANNQQVRPMPNGAAVTSGNGVQQPQPVYADPNDDWGSIIREAQRSMRQ